jgi:hypothetical protein
MAKFDAYAAAERIRPLLAANPWPDDKDELHIQTCLDEICKELDVEPSVLNMSHVAVLLAESDTGLHKADMYPKAHNAIDPETGRPAVWPAGHEYAGMPIVFLNPDQETEYAKLIMKADKKD